MLLFGGEKDPAGDIALGRKALAIGLASSYFLNHIAMNAQQDLLDDTNYFASLEYVIKAIRKDKSLPDDKPMIFFVHLDGSATPMILNILRAISDSFRSELREKLRCVFIPIITGSYWLEIKEVGDYSGTLMSLSPLSIDQSRAFISSVFRHITKRDLPQTVLEHPHFNVALTLAGGNLKCLECTAKELVEVRGEEGFKTEQDALDIIANTQKRLRVYYHSDLWHYITGGSVDAIIELIRTSFFHEDITRESTFNSVTYGYAERTGLFYLRPSPASQDKFLLDLPPLLMLTLDGGFGWGLFSKELIIGALRLDQGSSKEFIAYYLQAAFRILAMSKRADRKTLRSIFNNWAKGDKETMKLLDKDITPNSSIEVVTGTIKWSNNEMAVRRRKIKEPVDITRGKLIVIPGTRSTGIALTPYFGEQLKWHSPHREITRSQVEKNAEKVDEGYPLVIFSPMKLKNYKGSGSWTVKNVLFVVGEDFESFMGDFFMRENLD